MFILLTLALVCTAAASSGYGASTYNKPSYSGPSHSGHHGYYDYSSSSESSEEKHHKKCRKLKELSVPTGIPGSKPEFSFLERHGKNYLKISCPNSRNDYALIAGKQGSTTSINGGTPSVPNSILLATGINIDVVAKCHGKRSYIEANNGEKIRIKEVSCVDLGRNVDSA